MTNSHSNSEVEITLGLLKAVYSNAESTQRSLAADLGIALGLVNTYLKRCISKGYIKTRQIPRNRYAYYLTPTGFAEKSKLAAEFLHQSLSLFRQARADYRNILDLCAATGRKRLCLCGCSDLAEIFILLSADYQVDIVGIYDPLRGYNTFQGYSVGDQLSVGAGADAWILTSLAEGQAIYDQLAATVNADHIFAPDLLEIVRSEPAMDVVP